VNQTPISRLGLRPGDIVRVKAPEAILATLDEDNSLDKMPFMPEMLDACGKVFSVSARADKTCDTATKTGGRRLTDTVHLEGERCDGAAHGGCEAGCLNFWKEAWLERADGREEPGGPDGDLVFDASDVKTRLMNSTTLSGDGGREADPVYSCQATRLPEYTEPLSPWSMGQYWRDLTTNKVGIGRALRVAFLTAYSAVVSSGFAYRLWVSIYDSVQRLRGKQPWPYKTGTLASTPTGTLDLQVGDLVRVKDFEEILETLDAEGRNRGMRFDAEMVRFCGKTMRVHSRVGKIIDEGNGKMIRLKNPCIVLEGSWCSSDWSQCRRFCPRSIFHYWREIWLDRVADNAE